jgi:hypothetical protein
LSEGPEYGLRLREEFEARGDLGLALAAATGGWLLSGRQPPAIARQPLE